MRFYAWVEGTGYGCDYTIGCNTTVVELKATTKADALIEAIAATSSLTVPDDLCRAADSASVKFNSMICSTP